MFLRHPNIGTSKTFKEIVDDKEVAIDESALPDSTPIPELTNAPESNIVPESSAPDPLPLESRARELEAELKKQQEKAIIAMEKKHNHKRFLFRLVKW
jgi:hypothetical protein